MNKGISRSITGLLLSATVGTTSALPGVAQTSPTQVNPSQPGSSEPLGTGTVQPSNSPQLVAPPTQLTSPPLLSPSPSESGYTLGAGDLVKVDIFDAPEIVLEPRYSVLLDGTVNLPWVGSIKVDGLTLGQTADLLTQRYGRFIRNPIITVSIIAPRPLKIGVIGEVNRPGSYIISVISNESSIASLSQRTGSEGGSQWPTVSKAVQTAGGITQMANVRQIQVRRPNLRTGEVETINVDLWKFLKEGDLAQDLILRDGDTIAIPTATALDAAEVTQVAISNFSPENIRVNVVGEVENPGTVTVRPNTTLNQAILTAGSFKNKRADRKKVELIRLNPNGTVSRRTIAVDLSKGLNDENNPALRDNDVIVVRRNTITDVVDTLGVILTPLTSGVFGILRTLGIGGN